MTDDKEDKTLEQEEHYVEIAKSRDVEVLEGKNQYIELGGNLVPVTKSGEQLQLKFKAFRENRLPFNVRVKDQHADIVGRTLFMREPKVAKGDLPQTPICILNVVLPEKVLPDTISDSESTTRNVIRRIDYMNFSRKQNYLGDLRLADVSNFLGDDWIQLAKELSITDDEIKGIKDEYPLSVAQQAQSMLKLFQLKTPNDRNILENALRSINREDIITKCTEMQPHTDVLKKPELFRSRKLGSADHTYEEQDMMKDSESVEELVFQEGKYYNVLLRYRP